MPRALVAVLATDKIRHPPAASAVTRDAWTLASVCHSSDSSAGSSRSLEGTPAGVNAARAAGSPARGSTSPATSYPSAAKCRRAVLDMNSDRGIPVATSNAWMTGNQMPLTLTACLRIASGATSASRCSTSSRTSS